MDFALRYIRFYPDVNSRVELVTLALGLGPERPLRAVGSETKYTQFFHFFIFFPQSFLQDFG